MLLGDTTVAGDSYLQYGALGLLFVVLLAIFWKAVPQVGRFIEKNIEALGDRISNGLTAIGSQVGEMRKDLAGIETRHADHIEKVNGRLDRIETKVEEVKTIVSKNNQ